MTTTHRASCQTFITAYFFNSSSFHFFSYFFFLQSSNNAIKVIQVFLTCQLLIQIRDDIFLNIFIIFLLYFNIVQDIRTFLKQ